MSQDPSISGIFYHFEKYTTLTSGRTVGRKIGVVQEIIVRKHIFESSMLRDCVLFEPKVIGRSGATHKVEFVFFQPVAIIDLPIGGRHSIPNTRAVEITLLKINQRNSTVSIGISTAQGTGRFTLKQNERWEEETAAVELGSRLCVKLVSCTPARARLAVLDLMRPCASIESKRVGAQRFSNSNALGAGIQTIEKAKQAALVAMDFDLAFNDTMMCASGRDAVRTFRSLVALGNGVHWDDNTDLAILDTYVDFTYLVQDSAIIRYADYVKNLADQASQEFLPFFMAYFNGMTKTPEDTFTVTPADFVSMRPRNSPPLLAVVEAQIDNYQFIQV